jgi:hypothetical protein
MKHSLKIRVIAFVLVAIAGAAAFKLCIAGTDTPIGARGTWAQSQASQLVFFAVLEGLYRDGVTNTDVDLIIPPGENGKGNFNLEHFVYACPLCHPAYEAFRLYRHRDAFYGFKAPIDTLGTGLDETVKASLRSSDPNQRREAIEGLIRRWVGQRLEMMRHSKTELEQITAEIEQGRKKGLGGLKQPGQTRTNCPICDGIFGACKLGKSQNQK